MAWHGMAHLYCISLDDLTNRQLIMKSATSDFARFPLFRFSGDISAPTAQSLIRLSVPTFGDALA